MCPVKIRKIQKESFIKKALLGVKVRQMQNATHKKKLEWRTIKSCGKSNNENQVYKLS
jgi:hypothetical protein